MMANWRRWIRPGLVATLVLALLALIFRSGLIEGDLAERATERLQSAGHSWAEVDVSGRSLTIRGTAPSTEAQAAATESAGEVAGIRSVADASDLLPIASPYVWSVRKAGSVVTLVGSVPSEGFRTSVLAAARRAIPEAEIHDDLQLARGAAPAFSGGTRFVLDRLSTLADATVTISDSTLSVSGVAASPEAFGEARSVFRERLPAQLALGPIDILPARADPFLWSAGFDGESLTLAGYVPYDLAEQSLLVTAREALPGVPVIDKTSVASGAPGGFADAAAFAIRTLARLDEGKASLDGMRLEIAGKAKTVDDYDSVLAALDSPPADMHVSSSSISPATVSSYGWRGEKADGAVTLIGFVPSPEDKEDVAAAARELFAGSRLVDKVRIAAGEPRMDWIGAIKFAMGQLARLGRGSVVLGDRTFSIEGEAASPDAFTDLLAANAQTLPASLELESAEVRPPVVSPYRFVAARKPDSVTLDGHVASEEERKAIVEAVKGKFGTLRLVDNLVYASGAPEGFMRAATVSVDAVSRLAGGHSEITDSTVNISGAAYYPAAAGAVVDRVGETMPGGFDVALSITVRQPAQPVAPLRCRDLLQKTLMVGRIEFEGGKAEVSSDSYGLLDRVAATIERCPEATVEVGAHTDSDGSTTHNQELSQERADAIVEFLVDAGVRRERLTPKGYGESKPVADNATEGGKATNRRIEFLLAAPEEP